MEKYYTYLIEDFIVDDFFIRWVLNNSEEDNEIWTQWLQNNPEQAYKVEHARNIVTSIRFNKVEGISQAQVDVFIKRLKTEHLSQQNFTRQPVVKARVVNMRWLSVAALLIMTISFDVFFAINQYRSTANTTTYTPGIYQKIVNRGTSAMLIHLADGTSVILKPKSTFEYPQTFLRKNREVYLSGEAFFEVHKNPKQPFLVHSGKMIVRVVGTSFTVRAFNEARDFKVTVNTGKVYVYAPPAYGTKTHKIAEPVVLVHDQQVTYSNKDTQPLKQDLPKPTLLSQQVVQKTFDFKGIPVKEIINTLKQAYQVDINYNEKAFETCKLTAKLYDDSLYDKLTIICNAIDAKLSVVNGQIIITGGGGCDN